MTERDELVAAAQKVARDLGVDTLTCRDFKRATGIAEARILRHFDGWLELCRLAGISGGREPGRIDDDAVFAAMRDAFNAAGGICARNRFERLFRYSRTVFASRGGSYSGALYLLRDWLKTHDPGFVHLDSLERRLAEMPLPRVIRTRVAAEDAGPRPLGERIDFRAMDHAPTTEGGVIFLFGLVAQDLGFTLESIVPGFPDGMGKRRLADGRWRRVHIEFEYLARNFSVHGHDPAGCDLIVCWEDNWPDAPVEVIDLKTEIRRLAAQDAGRTDA